MPLTHDASFSPLASAVQTPEISQTLFSPAPTFPKLSVPFLSSISLFPVAPSFRLPTALSLVFAELPHELSLLQWVSICVAPPVIPATSSSSRLPPVPVSIPLTSPIQEVSIRLPALPLFVIFNVRFLLIHRFVVGVSVTLVTWVSPVPLPIFIGSFSIFTLALLTVYVISAFHWIQPCAVSQEQLTLGGIAQLQVSSIPLAWRFHQFSPSQSFTLQLEL